MLRFKSMFFPLFRESSNDPMTIDPTMPVVVPWITAFQLISMPRILSTTQRKDKFCRGLAVLSRRV